MFQSLFRPSLTRLYLGGVAIVTVILISRAPPLSVIFLGLLACWIYLTRCCFRIVLTDELREKINVWLQRILVWRHISPSMFCLVTSACLTTIAVFGHLISGTTLLVTLLVLSLVFIDKNKLINIKHKDFQWSEKLNYNNLEAEADDEFLPDVNETLLSVLERASNVATISSPTDANDEEDDERSDDIPSELLIPDVIPEIDEHSTDEDDDLAPLASKKQQQQQDQEKHSTLATTKQSDSEREDMNFRKGHFKRDSSLSTTSSSSEESLSKGLQFPDHTTVDSATRGNQQLRQLTDGSSPSLDPAGELVALAVKTQAQTLLANSGKLLPSLVSGLVQWGAGAAAAAGGDAAVATVDEASQREQQRRMVTALDSSDESDFEILETDDFK